VYESFVSCIQPKWETEQRDLKEKNKMRTIRIKCCCKENDKYREDGGTMMDKQEKRPSKRDKE
jgi:hypothetical protein